MPWTSLCKSQHSEGGICISILVGKQPEGEISGPATAQRVMQIPPSECWDFQGGLRGFVIVKKRFRVFLMEEGIILPLRACSPHTRRPALPDLNTKNVAGLSPCSRTWPNPDLLPMGVPQIFARGEHTSIAGNLSGKALRSPLQRCAKICGTPPVYRDDGSVMHSFYLPS
jgi:hypothetical protein